MGALSPTCISITVIVLFSSLNNLSFLVMITILKRERESYQIIQDEVKEVMEEEDMDIDM
jgi:hypothetical protein